MCNCAGRTITAVAVTVRALGYNPNAPTEDEYLLGSRSYINFFSTTLTEKLQATYADKPFNVPYVVWKTPSIYGKWILTDGGTSPETGSLNDQNGTNTQYKIYLLLRVPFDDLPCHLNGICWDKTPCPGSFITQMDCGQFKWAQCCEGPSWAGKVSLELAPPCKRISQDMPNTYEAGVSRAGISYAAFGAPPNTDHLIINHMKKRSKDIHLGPLASESTVADSGAGHMFCCIKLAHDAQAATGADLKQAGGVKFSQFTLKEHPQSSRGLCESSALVVFVRHDVLGVTIDATCQLNELEAHFSNATRLMNTVTCGSGEVNFGVGWGYSSCTVELVLLPVASGGSTNTLTETNRLTTQTGTIMLVAVRGFHSAPSSRSIYFRLRPDVE
ncbi:hypothetical protein DFH08DRAFT_808358 [Mycena albidolilacea]|uniref:Uncharacterized protein n=1 Tax=Mycena albidolilacea TaxID=1033008 RepID=A0AAD7A3J0_9AGAR|nr:hypothetical protein DFH08DRAFT_808358 [Mycena albidolilacea]